MIINIMTFFSSKRLHQLSARKDCWHMMLKPKLNTANVCKLTQEGNGLNIWIMKFWEWNKNHSYLITLVMASKGSDLGAHIPSDYLQLFARYYLPQLTINKKNGKRSFHEMWMYKKENIMQYCVDENLSNHVQLSFHNKNGSQMNNTHKCQFFVNHKQLFNM